jgi:predicted RNA-binding protein
MCSSTAYFRRESGEDLVLEDVMHLVPQSTGYRLVGLLGDEKILEDASLVEIDFENNRIVFEPRI